MSAKYIIVISLPSIPFTDSSGRQIEMITAMAIRPKNQIFSKFVKKLGLLFKNCKSVLCSLFWFIFFDLIE